VVPLGKYNWEEIKSQIELGKYTLKEIAKIHKPEGTKLKTAHDYIRQKKKNENWEKQAETHKKYTEKVTSKLAENEANKETKIRQEYDKMITNIRRLIYKTLLQERNTDRLRQCKLAIQALKDCRKEQWEINEIQEVAKKFEQELDINELPDINLVRGGDGGS
jgi:membrane-anchored protein YejM (alkaline phosphatase superfamily)